jgi:outer membrane protein TolC
VQAAQTDVQIAESQKDQAAAARILPQFDLTFVVGPSPEARGNALTGDSDLSSWSAFTRAEATLLQPLFTFGRLEAAGSAARAGLEARRAGLDQARGRVEAQVGEAYYGLLLAGHLWDLAEEARQEIGNARARVQEKLEAEEGDYTYTDLFRLDRFVFDVVENANKVEKGRRLVASALRRLLGAGEADSLILADGALEPMDAPIGPLSGYLDRAAGRHDLRQLRAGIAVREAQARAARAELFPQFFVGGQFKYSRAPNRDDQTSPFARDDFNFVQGGAVAGFRQTLSFGGASARARQARLEARKLAELNGAAEMGAALEIEKAYRELVEAQANVAAAETARTATRRWFVAARDGFNAGLEPASELIDAVKEYGIIRAKYFHAVFAYNRAVLALRAATGQSIVAAP